MACKWCTLFKTTMTALAKIYFFFAKCGQMDRLIKSYKPAVKWGTYDRKLLFLYPCSHCLRTKRRKTHQLRADRQTLYKFNYTYFRHSPWHALHAELSIKKYSLWASTFFFLFFCSAKKMKFKFNNVLKIT